MPFSTRIPEEPIFAGCRLGDAHITDGSCPCAPSCNPNEDEPEEPPYEEPLLISLQDSRYRLSSVEEGVLFDLDGDGLPEVTAWTEAGSDEAFLVLDRDQDGEISSGLELFGSATPQLPSASPNGFRALQVFDDTLNGGNGDGRIDASDWIFPYLQIWHDVNHNGTSELEELSFLPDQGIVSISLDYRESMHQDREGNVFAYWGLIDREGRGARKAWCVFFLLGD